jgi:tRNA(adenine34) deaminase
MCAGALIQARVGTLIYAAADPKRGALGGSLNLASHASAHHHLVVKGGVRGERAGEQLEDWFRLRRLARLGNGATEA